MKQAQPTAKTPFVIKRGLQANGVTILAWALAHGYKPQTVYQVMSGRLKCTRGITHRIAVELGLKKRPQKAA